MRVKLMFNWTFAFIIWLEWQSRTRSIVSFRNDPSRKFMQDMRKYKLIAMIT